MSLAKQRVVDHLHLIFVAAERLLVAPAQTVSRARVFGSAVRKAIASEGGNKSVPCSACRPHRARAFGQDPASWKYRIDEWPTHRLLAPTGKPVGASRQPLFPVGRLMTKYSRRCMQAGEVRDPPHGPIRGRRARSSAARRVCLLPIMVHPVLVRRAQQVRRERLRRLRRVPASTGTATATIRPWLMRGDLQAVLCRLCRRVLREAIGRMLPAHRPPLPHVPTASGDADVHLGRDVDVPRRLDHRYAKPDAAVASHLAEPARPTAVAALHEQLAVLRRDAMLHRPEVCVLPAQGHAGRHLCAW